MSVDERIYRGLSSVLYKMQDLFTAGDLLIMALVLFTITFLPLVLCVFRKRGSVRTVSMIVFIIYLFGNLSLTILNREVLSSEAIILTPGSDLQNAFYLDLGIAGVIRDIISLDFQGALSQIHVESSFMAREVILNVLLYFPMGYLLPFVFKNLRGHIFLITFIGFLCSCATESAQLYFHIGVFQLDDILLNTIGCFLGAVLGVILSRLWNIK